MFGDVPTEELEKRLNRAVRVREEVMTVLGVEDVDDHTVLPLTNLIFNISAELSNRRGEH